MKLFILVCVVALEVTLFCVVGGQVPLIGACPNRTATRNFDTQGYIGRWYEIEKYYTVFEAGGRCVYTYYSPRENGSLGIMNYMIQRNGRPKSIQGTATPKADDGSGKFGVTFDSLPFVGEAPYYVLSTDYKNYSIVWSCNDYALVNFQVIWFLARERDPSPEMRDVVHEKMDLLGIRRDLLMPTNQTGCAS